MDVGAKFAAGESLEDRKLLPAEETLHMYLDRPFCFSAQALQAPFLCGKALITSNWAIHLRAS